MENPLAAEEARVLACLIEKETATPEYYPLTLNALVNACNQKSNRDPVMSLTDRQVLSAIDKLKNRRWAVEVRPVDSRVTKFEHALQRALALSEQELALLCELLLRGPQTVGELRGRASRLYPFESIDEVQIVLDALMKRESGTLVLKLPLQPGRKESRYAQLLTGEPDLSSWAQVSSDFGTQNTAEATAFTGDLEARIMDLEDEVQELRGELERLVQSFAEFRSQFD